MTSVEHIEWARLTLPDCGTISLRALRVGRGPRVVIVSGLHGDETSAYFAVRRLLGAYSESLPCQLDIVPAVNRLGLLTRARRWPIENFDMNRAFGRGHDRGSGSGVIRNLQEFLLGAHLIIDLHNWDTPIARVGILWAASHEHSALEALGRFGCDFVWMLEKEEFTDTFAAWAASMGVPYCGLELQPPWLLSGPVIEDLAARLRRMVELNFRCHALPLRGQHVPCRAPVSGLFEPTVEVGTPLTQHGILGHIMSATIPDELYAVRASTGGLVMHLQHRGYVHVGDLVCGIGVQAS